MSAAVALAANAIFLTERECAYLQNRLTRLMPSTQRVVVLIECDTARPFLISSDTAR